MGSQRTILRIWLVAAVFWIAGVFFIESLDGQMGSELGEVFTTVLVPPLLPAVFLGGQTWSRVATAMARVIVPSALITTILVAMAYAVNRLVLR
jgi:hypothetical protein